MVARITSKEPCSPVFARPTLSETAPPACAGSYWCWYQNSYAPIVVVVAALLIIGAATLGLVLFGREVELTLPRVGTAVALTLLGTTIGAYEFWYQHQYEAAH